MGAEFRGACLEEENDDAVGDNPERVAHEHHRRVDHAQHPAAEKNNEVNGGKNANINKVFGFHGESLLNEVVKNNAP